MAVQEVEATKSYLIYVLEDDVVDRELIKRFLSKTSFNGCRVEEFGNPEDLYQRIKLELPSCILLDHKLVSCSAIDVIAMLKTLVRIEEMGVLLLTGNDNSEVVSTAFKSGVHDYIHKSKLDQTLLEDSIRRAISKAQQAKELRLSRESLQRSLVESKEAVSARDKVISVLSHELRNPITGIVGISKLFDLASLPERDAQYVGLIQNASVQALTLLDSLLESARTSDTAASESQGSISIREFINEIASLQLISCLDKELHVKVQISKEVPSVVKGPIIVLRQILSNLLANAVRFAPPSSVISVGVNPLESDDDESKHLYQFSVSDSGPGIPKESRESVFELYSRESKETRKTHGGNGIGLSIVKALVEKCNGRIWVESNADGGALFLFEFPLHSEVNSEPNNEAN